MTKYYVDSARKLIPLALLALLVKLVVSIVNIVTDLYIKLCPNSLSKASKSFDN